MSNNKKYLVLGIALVLLTFIGVSLAYFLTSIEGENKRVTISTSDLRIIFTNGDAIEGTEIEPGWSVTKTFSVENKTKNEYKYNIVIEDLINTFKTTGYLQYKITSTDGGYNMTSFEDVPKSSSALDTDLANNVVIPAKSKQNYTITIQYPNDENVNQSVDALNNAVLTGKLYISEGSNPSLLTKILRDNTVVADRTDFSVTNEATTTGTIYQTDKTEDGSTVYYYSGNTTNNWVKFGKETKNYCTYNGQSVTYVSVSENIFKKAQTEAECLSTTICEEIDSDTNEKSYIVGASESDCTSDDGSLVFTQNKASFSSNQEDIYWRIIRTTEDNGIKLLYSGNSHNTRTGYIGLQSYNEFPMTEDGTTNADPMYVGYMHGTSGTLNSNRTNENASTVKKYLDKWYVNNLITNYGKFVNSNTIYCNDRSVSSTDTYTSSKGATFVYGSYRRLFDNQSASYKCGDNGKGVLFETSQSVADKFNSSGNNGGNGKLKCSVDGYTSENCPIALVTADEIIFAGGVLDSPNSSSNNPNVWYHRNSEGNIIVGNSESVVGWWTMTPIEWFDNLPMVVVVYGETSDESSNGVLSILWTYEPNQLGVRPVISLNSCAKVTGTGTPEDPYVIDENSCS